MDLVGLHKQGSPALGTSVLGVDHRVERKLCLLGQLSSLGTLRGKP